MDKNEAVLILCGCCQKCIGCLVSINFQEGVLEKVRFNNVGYRQQLIGDYPQLISQRCSSVRYYKMRFTYLLYLDVEKYDGVASKVVSQIEAWQQLGHEVKLLCIVPKLPTFSNPLSQIASNTTFLVEEKVFGASAGLISGWFRPDKIQKSVLRILSDYMPDLVYLRNTAYSATLHEVNKRFITVSEINTLELAEYKLQKLESAKYFFRFLHHQLLHRFALNRVNGVVGVTHEIIHEVVNAGYKSHTAVIPNSINISNYLQRQKTSTKANLVPRLVFIGTPGMSWHGVDRIIAIAAQTLDQLEFHIIGYGAHDFTNAPKNVKFYGVLPSSETHKVISSCDIGIGTLALYRKNMVEACPLKVRECLAYGLPMILGYEDTAFILNSKEEKATYPDFILKLPNHQENLEEDVKRVLEFSKDNVGRVVSMAEIAPYIDVQFLEKRRLEFLERVYGSIEC